MLLKFMIDHTQQTQPTELWYLPLEGVLEVVLAAVQLSSPQASVMRKAHESRTMKRG